MATDNKKERSQKFSSGELDISVPQCHTCKHWNGDLTCEAFPNGILQGVLMGSLDHRRAIKGDNGIRYEKAAPKKAQKSLDGIP